MAGKAYNPEGFEPEAHERFLAPPPEVMEAYKRVARHPTERLTYDEIMEYRSRGESASLGHYVYEMMFDIYAGIEDRVFQGAIDSHLHIYPDYAPRSVDMIELAINASKAGMDAVVCKDHFFTNVGTAWGAQRFVEDMVRRGELERSCKVFGTHMLAWSHHPDQVNLIRKYPNLGAVFFYTMTGGRMAGPELRIVDDNGELDSEVKECLHKAAEYDILIMTGHKSYQLVRPMVEYCHKVGGKILVTHAEGTPRGPGGAGTVEQAKELAELGAYFELGANKAIPNMMWPCVDPNAPFEWARAVGPEHCVANTDFGQVTVQKPVEGFKLFVRMMIHYGFTDEEIRLMIHTNPAKLLGLEE